MKYLFLVFTVVARSLISVSGMIRLLTAHKFVNRAPMFIAWWMNRILYVNISSIEAV